MVKLNSIIRRVAVAFAAALLLQGCMLLFDDTPSEPTVFYVSGETTVTALDTLLNISVSSDARWTVTMQEGDWLTMTSPQNGKGKLDGVVTFRFDFNKADGPREATVLFQSGSRSVLKTVTQQGFGTFFDPAQVALAGTSPSKLSFTSPYTWAATVAEGGDWFQIDRNSGNPGAVTINVTAKDPNENVGSRSGKIAIALGKDLVFSIPVVQSQKDIVLSDKAQVNLEFEDTEFSVFTQSNVQYSIETSADWIHHTSTKALNEATEYFTVDENPGAETRSAKVSFKAEGLSPVSVTVNQKGCDPVLRINVPGLYGINGTELYVLGAGGWNQSSRVTAADGSFEYRMLNAGALKVLRVTGIDRNAAAGASASVSIVMMTKDNKTLDKSLNVTVLRNTDDMMWLKNSANTYLIIQK